ncbi:MAG: ornithine carbamoyltransferase [Candidatus Cloacimonadota bacterium]|nr:MAG: ornithine carbamoyltransferase [Candidatus Cloacimonadota bacterium]
MRANFKGRDFLSLLDFSKEEFEYILDVASDLKRRNAIGELHNHILPAKSLYMIFYNQSLRTRNSFESGMTQLGGHAHYLASDKIYTPAIEGEEKAYSTERVSDVARTLSRFGHAIAIRMYGPPTNWIYGKAHSYIREFAKWADIPVINMECDKYHPCQAGADMLTIKEKLGGFKGKKFVMSWAYSPSYEKPLSVPQSAIIAATKLGMDVVQVQPHGFELDDKIIYACKDMAEQNASKFEIMYDMEEAFKDADVVYPKCWGAKKEFDNLGKGDDIAMRKLFEKNKNWICNQDILSLAKKNVLYMHCLPADRGFEVTDDVIDGPNSVVFDEAENRLHFQKAVMALIMR